MKTLSLLCVSVCFALLIGSVVAEHTNVNPVYPAAVVFVVGIAASFARKEKGVAYAATQADIFNPSQLQVKDIVMAAIYQHYGYTQNAAGQWTSGPAARQIPELLDKLRITRKDLHQIRYLTPTESVFEFFDKAQDPNAPFASNFKEASLQGNRMMVFFGITGELATGAAAADTPDILAFGTPGAGDEELINGLVSWDINKEKELDVVAFKSLFINDDAIKNFFRFPRIIIWEPSNDQKLTLRLSKAYAAAVHKFAKFSLIGFELGR